MRIWAILVWLAFSAVQTFAACGASDVTVKDRALHRQWRIQRDCRNPARPAHLVEVPWGDPVSIPGDEAARATDSKLPLIRRGMRVAVERESEHAQIFLTGTALEAGYAGQKILVKAGFGAAPLHGIVRGPGLVALEPEKGGH